MNPNDLDAFRKQTERMCKTPGIGRYTRRCSRCKETRSTRGSRIFDGPDGRKQMVCAFCLQEKDHVEVDQHKDR